MAAVIVTDDIMRYTVEIGDVTRIEDWVYAKVDLSKWRDISGNNFYHLCVLCGKPSVLEKIDQTFPQYRCLVKQENGNGMTPLLMCCKSGPYIDSATTLATIDLLLRLDGQPTMQTFSKCISVAKEHNDIRVYLRWRKGSPSGLPNFIKKENNDIILKYINVVETVDKGKTKRYQKCMLERQGVFEHIRIFYVGPEGVGKSTLCRRMTNRSTQNIRSTDLMDSSMNRLAVNLRTCQRREIHEDTAYQLSIEKIRKEIHHSDQKLHPPGVTSPTTSKPPTRPNDGERLDTLSNEVKENDVPKHTLDRQKSSFKFPLGSYGQQSEREKKLIYNAAEINFAGDLQKSTDEEAYISLWDFAGEELYMNTNHLFLTGDAVFLLLFNIVQCINDSRHIKRLHMWLKSIDALSEDRSSPTLQAPPIVLIGTHLDQLPGSDSEKTLQAESFYSDIVTRHPVMAAIAERHIVTFFPLDNLKDDNPMYEMLWYAIVKAAQHQSHWKCPVPMVWLALERDIMLAKGKRVRVMTLDEVIEKVKGLEVEVKEGEFGVEECLRYLHRTGIILCFGTDSPDSKIITDPQWLARGFRAIITARNFMPDIPEHSEVMDHYYKTGEITLALIKLLWGKEKEDGFLQHEPVLIAYMVRLGLLTPPLSEGGIDIDEVFFVPSILPEAEPEKIQHLIENTYTQRSATLCFVFINVFVSSPVYDKVMAFCIHNFGKADLTFMEQGYCLQRGLGCFRLNRRRNMVLHCQDSIIKLTMFSSTSDDALEAGEGFHLKNVLTAMLKTVLVTNQQGHLVKEFDLFLDKSYRVTNDGKYVRESDLAQSSEPLDCSGPANSKTVCKSDWDVWFVDPSLRADVMESATVSPFNTVKRFTSKQMSRIAKYIGSSYCLLFTELGMKLHEMEQVRESYSSECFRTFITQLLCKWQNGLPPKSSIQSIYTALSANHVETSLLSTELQSDIASMDPSDEDACRVPNENDIDCIALRLNKSYVIFFLELGMEIAEVDQAMLDCKNVRRAFTKLLKQWVDRCGQTASMGRIYKAMQECGMEHNSLRE
ncbi:uncharacterized protein LOC110455160 isoform X2 [Mizuhopecten yessoensis]|uniref:Serine/threonine-protein kinase roco5 n=1 Tax=Mizuhopecten yessoensis TaxID=6573 RepID=A0A210QDM6_MIZYE|nr:uncharacterized protein LOC110455160 isoform X2 [Mizuhopecten yessoensis]OWF46832.1 serine/threonine-protein kinase roco5 [Mizuhopecten yessoensis]